MYLNIFINIPDGKKYISLQGVIFNIELEESISAIVAKYLLLATEKII